MIVSYFHKTAVVNCNDLATIILYLLCLGPDNILQEGGKAFADPFLSPVSGSDNQAKPGVGNLMAKPGPTQRQAILPRTRTPSRQHTLRQENYMWAVEDK